MKANVIVSLYGREVGRLLWDAHKGNSYFIFSEDYKANGPDIAPLAAPLNGIAASLPIWGERDKYQNLPPFLADSLPDSWGNQLFDVWRIQQKIPRSAVTPLEKLSFIGRRGIGALEFKPDVENLSHSDPIDVASLVQLAQRIFADREDAVVAPEESLSFQSLIAVGTSAGGRQPKAVVAISRTNGDIRSGQIAGLDGYDYYLLKFGDAQRSMSEIEMTYYEMARRAGINMMDSRLLTCDGGGHFLTKRFDRDANGAKLHTQTLAAIYPGVDSYESLVWVCRRMRLPETSVGEVFRRMVFNVLANNTDDHDKNFSFLMDKSGQWSLAPAYDMTFIFNTGGFLPQDDRCLSIRGKRMGVTREDITAFAKDAGIRRADVIISDVISALSDFRSFAEKNGVRNEWIGRIEAFIAKQISDWRPMSIPLSAPTNAHEAGVHTIVNAHLEPAYKGNIHLLATVDGRDRKYVLRPSHPAYAEILNAGLANFPECRILELVRSLILKE